MKEFQVFLYSLPWCFAFSFRHLCRFVRYTNGYGKDCFPCFILTKVLRFRKEIFCQESCLSEILVESMSYVNNIINNKFFFRVEFTLVVDPTVLVDIVYAQFDVKNFP